MQILKALKDKRAADKRQVITISIKTKTIEQLEKLAQQANLSVSFLAGEVLDMGLALGQTVEVFGEQMENFAEKLLAANSVIHKATKKPVRRTTKKPVKFGGRR